VVVAPDYVLTASSVSHLFSTLRLGYRIRRSEHSTSALISLYWRVEPCCTTSSTRRHSQMHGLDTSNVSSRVISWCDEQSGLWA